MGMDKRTYIIAEAGVNHNGSVDIAKGLIDVAVAAGADAVKFQTFKAESLVGRSAPKAKYQLDTTDETESQYDMIKRLELSKDAHMELIRYCSYKNIEFLSTPFDIQSLDFLAYKLKISKIKIPSGEITNGPLLLKAALTGKPVILSTGMSTLGEVEMALSVLAFGYSNTHPKPSISNFQAAYYCDAGQSALKEKVTLLHCTTEYPAPFGSVNLLAMDTLRLAFGLPVGFSDHTPGVAVSIAAVARGATVIEKHFTLDQNLPGPDHKASLEPDELKMMVESIRDVELSMGSPVKIPTPCEEGNKVVARKSLVAAKNIGEGERLTEDSIAVKRPGSGISPMHYWEFINSIAAKSYKEDEVL